MAASSSLQQAVALAKGQSGLGLVSTIERALRAKDAFLFGELLELPSIQALEADPAHQRVFALLRLFASGTYGDFKAAPEGSYPALDAVLLDKLKVITLLTLASSRKSLAYSELMGSLDVASSSELEQLVIAAVYSGLLTARMDQRAQIVQVSHCAGRDVRTDPSQLAALHGQLSTWSDSIHRAMGALQGQIDWISQQREAAAKKQAAHVRQVRACRLSRLKARPRLVHARYRLAGSLFQSTAAGQI